MEFAVEAQKLLGISLEGSSRMMPFVVSRRGIRRSRCARSGGSAVRPARGQPALLPAKPPAQPVSARRLQRAGGDRCRPAGACRSTPRGARNLVRPSPRAKAARKAARSPGGALEDRQKALNDKRMLEGIRQDAMDNDAPLFPDQLSCRKRSNREEHRKVRCSISPISTPRSPTSRS